MKAVYDLARIGDAWVLQRSKGGEIRYLERYSRGKGLVNLVYEYGIELVAALNNGYGPGYVERRWVEREGSRLDSKKPIGIGPMRRPAITVNLPAGRHDKGYPKV